MACPRCEEEVLKKIQFVPNGQVALLCDSCQTVWTGDESVVASTGESLHSYAPEEGYEYYIDIFDDKDQEHQEITGKLV